MLAAPYWRDRFLEALMFDPKKMLDDLLGTNVPGAGGTVRDKLGQAGQMAKDNPLAAGALAAVLLGTGTGRAVTGSALRLGGLAAIATLGYKAYQNYKNGDAPVAQTRRAGPDRAAVRLLLQHRSAGEQGIHPRPRARHDRRRAGGRAYQ